jgi:hypothetical protein
MLDDGTTGASAPLPRCMWCSAELPSESEVTCPTCGATLIGDGDNPVPGVTAIDAEAIVRNTRSTGTKPRSRLMSWISGEYDEGEDHKAPPGSLSPPPFEVRREILRLELEAEVANLQAEADAMAAEAAVESGVPLDTGMTLSHEAVTPASPDEPADQTPDVPADPTPDTAAAAASEEKPTS